MFSIAVDAGKLSHRPKFDMLDGEKSGKGLSSMATSVDCSGIYPMPLNPQWSFFTTGAGENRPS
jgi:hypothetical protein